MRLTHSLSQSTDCHFVEAGHCPTVTYPVRDICPDTTNEHDRRKQIEKKSYRLKGIDVAFMIWVTAMLRHLQIFHSVLSNGIPRVNVAENMRQDVAHVLWCGSRRSLQVHRRLLAAIVLLPLHSDIWSTIKTTVANVSRLNSICNWNWTTPQFWARAVATDKDNESVPTFTFKCNKLTVNEISPSKNYT